MPSTARAKPRSVCARACGKQGRARAAGVGLSKKQGKRGGRPRGGLVCSALLVLFVGWAGLGLFLFLFDLSAWAWAGLQRLEVTEGQHGHARDLRLDLLTVRQRLGGVRAWVPARGGELSRAHRDRTHGNIHGWGVELVTAPTRASCGCWHVSDPVHSCRNSRPHFRAWGVGHPGQDSLGVSATPSPSMSYLWPGLRKDWHLRGDSAPLQSGYELPEATRVNIQSILA